MARARNIKPSFFMNDKLADCQPLARLLFAGLWTVADREGRLEDTPRKIKVQTLPYDDCDIDMLLNELQENAFIQRYEVDKSQYIQILRFKEHQNPHIKEVESTIPAPTQHHTSTVPNVLKTEYLKPKTEEPKPESVILPAWLDESVWKDLKQHRKDIKKPMSLLAEKRMVTKITQMKEKGYDWKERIEYSIRNGYPDIYEPTYKQGNRQSNGRPETEAQRRKRLEDAGK